MQEENINFEEIGKDETAHVEQSSSLFKQPIRGRFQSLYEELKARCAPENFMNPYEPEKVSRANELYSDVLATNAQDEEKLKELRLRAIEELGIKFSMSYFMKNSLRPAIQRTLRERHITKNGWNWPTDSIRMC